MQPSQSQSSGYGNYNYGGNPGRPIGTATTGGGNDTTSNNNNNNNNVQGMNTMSMGMPMGRGGLPIGRGPLTQQPPLSYGKSMPMNYIPPGQGQGQVGGGGLGGVAGPPNSTGSRMQMTNQNQSQHQVMRPGPMSMTMQNNNTIQGQGQGVSSQNPQNQQIYGNPPPISSAMPNRAPMSAPGPMSIPGSGPMPMQSNMVQGQGMIPTRPLPPPQSGIATTTKPMGISLTATQSIVQEERCHVFSPVSRPPPPPSIPSSISLPPRPQVYTPAGANAGGSGMYPPNNTRGQPMQYTQQQQQPRQDSQYTGSSGPTSFYNQNSNVPGYPIQQPAYPSSVPPSGSRQGYMPNDPNAKGPIATGGSVARPRIDPNQIPRPLTNDNNPLRYVARGHTMTTPPPAASNFVCVDEGCCNPRFIRPTLNYVPQTKELRKQCGIPLAVIITPLASLHNEETPIPSVDFSTLGVTDGPVRCTRCRGYINPFVKFVQNGTKFQCNLCCMMNSVPTEYYCGIDQYGLRRDSVQRPELSKGSVEFVVPTEYYCGIDQYGLRRDSVQRPELSKGSVEFVVPSEYSIRPPQKQIIIYVFDVSNVAIENGYLQASIENAKNTINFLPEEASVGIVTFDKHVHFYELRHRKNDGTTTEATDQETKTTWVHDNIIADIDDPFSPLPSENFICLLKVFRQNIIGMLDHILTATTSKKGMVSTSSTSSLTSGMANLSVANNNVSATKNDAALGAALQSIMFCLKLSGGRLCCFFSSLPRVGIGRLQREENINDYGTESERFLYNRDMKSPEGQFYMSLVNYAVNNQISVDFFISTNTGNTFIDSSTIGPLCYLTGGNLYLYPSFAQNIKEHRRKFFSDLSLRLLGNYGSENVLKIRSSAGLRIETIYGNYYSRGHNNSALQLQQNDEIEIPILDSSHSFGVVLNYDDDLEEGTDVHIQAALLYTNLAGKRLVRVHNLALQVSPLLSNVFRYADLDTTVCLLLKEGAHNLIASPESPKSPLEIHEATQILCIDVLSKYRQYCASNSASGQLILPESLKLLPLYTLGLVKSLPFRLNRPKTLNISNVEIKADERYIICSSLYNVTAGHAISVVYPVLYCVYPFEGNVGNLDERNEMAMPLLLPPTAEKLEEVGIYILSSYFTLYMYIGQNVDNDVLLEIFGDSRVDSTEKPITLLDPTNAAPASEIPVKNSNLQRFHNIINILRRRSPFSPPLEIITKGDWRSARFMSLLVEDHTKNGASYVEFLCQVHKSIQQRMLK